MLDRFDGYPDLDDIPPPRPERDAMEEAKREMEDALEEVPDEDSC